MRLITLLLIVPIIMLVAVILVVPNASGILLALVAIGAYFTFVVARASDWRSMF